MIREHTLFGSDLNLCNNEIEFSENYYKLYKSQALNGIIVQHLAIH